MLKNINRRNFLSKLGAASAIGYAATGTAQAANEITFKRTFQDYRNDPIENARIQINYYSQNAENGQVVAFTNSDGEIDVTLPSEARLTWGFYKSSETEFLASRLDGVPHIHFLDRIQVTDSGTDSGIVVMPKAHKLEARAVFAGKPGGVESAIPRFGSLLGNSYFASGYSFTTTNSNGYMKLIQADFTGVEMAGSTKLWMYPPTYEPYEEQDKENYAPYEKVDVTELDIDEDENIVADISRRPDDSVESE